MTKKQAISILQKVNDWRTGKEGVECTNFRLTDEALQLAFPELERRLCYGVAERLKKYIAYIRGMQKEQPCPKQVTVDIAAAIWALQENATDTNVGCKNR